MFILYQIIAPLQDVFSNTNQGKRRKQWFVYVLFSIIVPFTSSISSNILRSLNTCLGLISLLIKGFIPLWQVLLYHGSGYGKLCGA